MRVDFEFPCLGGQCLSGKSAICTVKQKIDCLRQHKRCTGMKDMDVGARALFDRVRVWLASDLPWGLHFLILRIRTCSATVQRICKSIEGTLLATVQIPICFTMPWFPVICAILYHAWTVSCDTMTGLNADNFEHHTQAASGQTTGIWQDFLPL